MNGSPSTEHPTVLVPYPGPEYADGTLDVFVYLRPESNGVAVESTILKAIRACRASQRNIDLVYMANVPGDYIVNRRIVERHYALRLFFSVAGGRAFTDDMQAQFSDFYGEPFELPRVIGAFAALRHFGWEPEELFDLWVDEDNVTRIAGQVIKRYRDLWIVNYDIPALLHKNNAATDIAVMTFRTREGYPHFFELAREIRSTLVANGLLKRDMPISRAVHISRSPFEQLLDARDYLLNPDGSPVGVEQSSFAAFLLSQGVSRAEVNGLLNHPICGMDFEVDAPRDQNLLDLCEGFGYEDALHIIRRVRSQLRLPTS